MRARSALEEMTDALTTHGLEHAVLPAGAEGAILVLPEHGRVLGLYPALRSSNAFWVNPAFLGSLAIGAKDDSWITPGGDRIWLAPRDEFLPDGAQTPPAVDPGHFGGRRDRAGYVMENKGEVRAWRSELSVRFRVLRRVQPLDEQQLERAWGQTWLRRAGYTEEMQLSVSGPCPRDGMWLAQSMLLPPGSQARMARHPESRCACVVPAEAGHAQLVVRQCGVPAETAAAMECRVDDSSGAVEATCFSPLLDRGQRVSWTTATCVFAGREEEIRGMADRLMEGER